MKDERTLTIKQLLNGFIVVDKEGEAVEEYIAKNKSVVSKAVKNFLNNKLPVVKDKTVEVESDSEEEVQGIQS
jgi:hypothetical protein